MVNTRDTDDHLRPSLTAIVAQQWALTTSSGPSGEGPRDKGDDWRTAYPRLAQWKTAGQKPAKEEEPVGSPSLELPISGSAVDEDSATEDVQALLKLGTRDA